jgi:cytochrome c peroxidase
MDFSAARPAKDLRGAHRRRAIRVANSRGWLLTLGALALTAGTCGANAGSKDPKFELSTQCPPSFEKSADGTCALRTLYDLYEAPPGFGGLRVPLPKARDGFKPQVIDLGRFLFFDPILSEDHATSCANCHDPAHGFTDGQAQARGRGGSGVGRTRQGGVVLQRGTPTLWNVAFLSSFDWDGHATSLEDQATKPLLSPDELGNTRDNLERDLNANAVYRRLFQQAFPGTANSTITVDLVCRALAAFEASLISLNSRYDRYAHGDSSALSSNEIQGLVLFSGFVTRCSQCHTPPLFTNGELAVIGAPDPPGVKFDHGAGGGGDAELNGAFRIPTLRNIAVTAPYMHSGAFATLEQVVAFYNTRQGPPLPTGEHVVLHWNIHPEGLGLSAAEVTAISAFLRTLTDESFLPTTPSAVPSGLPLPSRAAPRSSSVHSLTRAH